MQDYTKKITYLQQELTNGEAMPMTNTKRLCIDPTHPSYSAHSQVFSHDGFKYPYLPLYLGKYDIDVSKVNVNVLRMLIRMNNRRLNFGIPKELEALSEFVETQANYHRQYYPSNADCYIYITVRTTEPGDCYYANSQSWHVDGFQGARVNRHLPEQDIVWSNVNPTEFLLQPFYLDGLDASKHDVNHYFATNADDNMAYTGLEKGVYLLTPHNIHRVSNKPFEYKRVFVRLTFSPVMIEDPTNTPNPMIPVDPFPDRLDVRNCMWAYEIDETSNNGFVKLK